jgi:thiol-disulfide isomerase/thioredoxin
MQQFTPNIKAHFMKKILTLALTLFTLFTFTHAANEDTSLIEMTMTDIAGNTYEVTGTTQGFKIKGLENKIVFLEFFGHKCPPCLASIPHMIALQEKYKENLAIVSIEVQGYNQEQLKQFADEKKMNYIVASEEQAGEFVNYIQQRAQWQGGIPFLVAADTQGNVQFVEAGFIPEASLEELIAQLTGTKK